jgi:hypothetical protein
VNNKLSVSGEALGEYENLHRKFAIEQECRDKAEEYAKQVLFVWNFEAMQSGSKYSPNPHGMC